MHSAAALKRERSHSEAGANLARFWELMGRRVFEEGGILWGKYKGPFFSTLPFQLKLDWAPAEAAALLRRRRLPGLCFSSHGRPGIAHGMYVRRPAGYDLSAVARKQRGQVLQGLEICEIREVDPDELLRDGMALNRDTLARQSRQDANFLDPARWKRLVNAVRACPGMSVRGAYVNGRLASYLISCRDGDWLHLIYKMSRTADLAHYPNHALDFSILRDAGRDSGITWVGNGFASLTPNQGLDRYKRHLGYEVAPHNLCIHFHPLLAPALSSRLTISLARAAHSLSPDYEPVAYRRKILEGACMSSKTPDTAGQQPAAFEACQQEMASGFSRLLRPGFVFPALRVIQTLRQGGSPLMMRKFTEYANKRLKRHGNQPSAAPRPFSPEEALNLQPGELVEVKSIEEIRATLDRYGKNRGLLFTANMADYAGRRLRVFKRVSYIFLEESKQHRKVSNTVLLENVYCHGEMFQCDRSCFLFWKEVWLRRIPESEASTAAPALPVRPKLVQIEAQCKSL